MTRHGTIGYVEIPVRDVAAAATFYGELFGWTFNREESEGGGGEPAYWMFSGPDDPQMGALERKDTVEPHVGGPLSYIRVDDIAAATARVAELGGTVERGRTEIGEDMGVYAIVRDLDGNRWGLWSTG